MSLFDQLKKLTTTYHGNDTKITWDNMEKILDRNDQAVVDAIYLMQTTMLKQLPSERINGILNLYYIVHGNGTEEDVKNSLVRT